MRTKSLNHSKYQHQYHIVWGTKYRRKYLKDYVALELRKSFYRIVKKYPELHIFALNTDEDHLHVQIEIPPSVSVASVVKLFKGISSSDLKKRFKFIERMYLDGKIWSVGYFSSTIGINEETIKKYIEEQGRKEQPQ